MPCDKCKTHPASVHVERIVNGAKTEYNLCIHCAAQERSDMGADVSFDNLLKEFLGSIIGSLGLGGQIGFAVHPNNALPESLPVNKADPMCEACGVTFEKLREEGKFGCVNCYSTFRPQIDRILVNVHGSTEHMGKTPKKAPREMLLRRTIETTRKELREAIDSELYERAAELRDKIRAAQAELSDNDEHVNLI